jgi:uncharacterized SAM-binding protein YcdF (DUF218 family)
VTAKLTSILTLKRVAFVLAGVLLTWTGFSAWSIYNYASYSDEVKADGIVVLGAAAWEDQPSPVFQERINHAIQLYKDGYAPIIVFTGGKGDGEDWAESEVAGQYAVEHGAEADAILVETQSRTTEQNLYYAGRLAADHHLTTLILVSDPLHMKRAMLIAQDMGLKVYSSPTPTTRYQSFVAKLQFLIRETYYYQRYLLRRPFYRYQPGTVQGNSSNED